ncbi:Transcriptional regulator PadR-like family protein [Nonomuraea solani]|uniref:Transcriptional regulator PadR-like family protein n=1 Tax=Nonomuraea solani TaxID=1144553 RepID=A0A1H6CY92_9ACTN|nr:PadR family transcriptional regulator [Nonomuraea solani]SEG77505.1 Transcriptional regulator PadR-like family protein [Nonomuraea solani]
MARGHDLVGLTVLALLSVRASHPYELHRFIVDTHKDYITGLPRSLYHAVERLAKDELVVPTGTDREGRRPERTVYEITEEGREELRSRLRQLLEKPQPDRRAFVAAVSLVGCLPLSEAQGALRARAATIEGLLTGMNAHLRAAADSGLPAILTLEVELERALHAAELDWIKELLDRLDKGELDWAVSIEM